MTAKPLVDQRTASIATAAAQLCINMKFAITLAALACIVVQAVSAAPLVIDDGELDNELFFPVRH